MALEGWQTSGLNYLSKIENNIQQETLGVVTITMACPTFASLWKYFRRLVYNPVEHLYEDFIAEIVSS